MHTDERGEGNKPINEALRRSLVERIGWVPRSTPDTTRIIRGVWDPEEGKQIASTGYGFDGMGFAGNGFGLSSYEENALDEIAHTHRGAPIVEIFALPNIREEHLQAWREGKLPKEFPLETLFAHSNNAGEAVRSSGVNQDANLILDPIFFEGYYNKQTNSWTPNPQFWENALRTQATLEGWTEEQFQQRRQEKYNQLKQSALQNMNTAVQAYQESQRLFQQHFDESTYADSEDPPIRIP